MLLGIIVRFSTSINNNKIEFESYIIPTNDLDNSFFRLLDVDNRTIIPYNIHIRKLISQRPGIFFGQCSEICGANHRFIPIVIEIINMNSITIGINLLFIPIVIEIINMNSFLN